MMILYSKLIGAPIADLKSQSKIGQIADLVINDTDLSIAGVVVETGLTLLSKKKVVATADFVNVSKNGIVVRDAEALVDISELVRIEKLYSQKCYGLAQKVVTKSGQYIGHVYDYLIDSTSVSIRKFYTKKLFTDKIISVTAVIAFEGKVITIKDDKPYVFSTPSVETALD